MYRKKKYFKANEAPTRNLEEKKVEEIPARRCKEKWKRWGSLAEMSHSLPPGEYTSVLAGWVDS